MDTWRLVGAGVFFTFFFDSFLFGGTPENIGVGITSAQAWAPQEGTLEVMVMGILENAGVTKHFRPLMGSCEGRCEVATSDFVPFPGTPEKAPRSTSALMWPPEKAGVR